jgi:hypothetical protein
MVNDIPISKYLDFIKRHKNKKIKTYYTNIAPSPIEDLNSKDGYTIYTSKSGEIVSSGQADLVGQQGPSPVSPQAASEDFNIYYSKSNKEFISDQVHSESSDIIRVRIHNGDHVSLESSKCNHSDVIRILESIVAKSVSVKLGNSYIWHEVPYVYAVRSKSFNDIYK